MGELRCDSRFITTWKTRFAARRLAISVNDRSAAAGVRSTTTEASTRFSQR